MTWLHGTCECAEFTGLYLTRVEVNVHVHLRGILLACLLDSLLVRNLVKHCLDF